MARKKKKPLERYIVAALRKIWFYSDLRTQAAKKAKVGSAYQCSHCGKIHDKIQIDHVIEVGSPNNPDGTHDWGQFIDRLLYCSPTNLEALCKSCHLKKTNEYRKNRLKSKIKKDKLKK